MTTKRVTADREVEQDGPLKESNTQEKVRGDVVVKGGVPRGEEKMSRHSSRHRKEKSPCFRGGGGGGGGFLNLRGTKQKGENLFFQDQSQ